MRFFSILFLLTLIIAGSYFFIQKSDFSIKETLINEDENLQSEEPTETNEKASEELASSEEIDNVIHEMDGELSSYMGENSDTLIQKLGEPLHKDPSSYSYESWVYTDEETEYIEFGIMDGKVCMVFAAGENLSISPVKIGQSYKAIHEEFGFQREISFSVDESPYKFQLNAEDLEMRPLVQIDENTFLQFYFDTFENKLSSVRFLNKDIIIAHRPYEIYYRNHLPLLPELSEEEWEAVQAGMERQVFELTNVLRHQYGAGKLNWDEPASRVAFGHSKDMYQNDYFSHYSLDGRGLRERLSELEVEYFSAGENIAAQYTDSPAAVEGWLNSEGHREALLNDSYTHLGVGVYRYFYTQNFLQKS